MNDKLEAVVLTAVQKQMLIDLLDHDADVLAEVLHGDDFDMDLVVTTREWQSEVLNALIGKADADGAEVESFYGTRENGCGSFTLTPDMSLDDGIVTLTGDDGGSSTFMGWMGSRKFVMVPSRDAEFIASCIDVALDDADVVETHGLDDIDLVHAFADAVRRVSDAPARRNLAATPEGSGVFDADGPGLAHPPKSVPAWVIVGPYGEEWRGEADDEIAALDLWCGDDMESYTDALRRNALEGDGPMVYRDTNGDGRIRAIHSNYEVVVVPAGEYDADRKTILVHLNASLKGDDPRTADDISGWVRDTLDAALSDGERIAGVPGFDVEVTLAEEV